MMRALGMTAQQMVEVEQYACIEPVGEGMVDYAAGDKPAKRQAVDIDLKARLSLLADEQKGQLKEKGF